MLRSRSAIRAATFARKTWLINAFHQDPEKIAELTSSITHGEHKRVYHPAQDVGDNVILINTRHIKVPGNMWEEKTVYECTGRTRSVIRLAWREAHLLDPTKIVKTCLSEKIRQVRPPQGFETETSGMDEMYAIRRSIHQSHPEQVVQYTKRDYFFDRVLNSTQTLKRRVQIFPDGIETIPESLKNDIFDELDAPEPIFKSYDDYRTFESRFALKLLNVYIFGTFSTFCLLGRRTCRISPFIGS